MPSPLIPVEQIKFELSELADDVFHRVQGDHADALWMELRDIFQYTYTVTSWWRLARRLRQENNEKQA